MRAALLLLTLALAGCATGYRDQSVPISSIALFDTARFAGRWYEIASFPVPTQAGCVNTEALYSPRADGQLDVNKSCQVNGQTRQSTGQAELTGPGRLSVKLDGGPAAAPHWVLWVDQGYRTAVIGVPSGHSGWILNRDPVIPPDRLKAAREVLAFNGYDLRALRMTPQRQP